jgi:CHAT domain-containing protein
MKPSVAQTLVAFGNPDFAGSRTNDQPSPESKSMAPHPLKMHDMQGISLPPLPGTETECAAVKTQAEAAGWKVVTFLGEDATEAALRQVQSPGVLHLATHGFFLPETGRSPQAENQPGETQDTPAAWLVNPMERSGFALAGAGRTLQAWARGAAPPTGNDGIVTAEEVGGLTLDGTWLVVLSACDTGVGEARAGEGVMGLRRGFIQAGAQNLLMTLWPVSDETTAQIMLDFYSRAFATGNAPQALAETQRDWLVKLRKEKRLLAAVTLCGAFIMSSQGKP